MATAVKTHKAAARTAAKHITTAKPAPKVAPKVTSKAVTAAPAAKAVAAPAADKRQSKDKRVRDTFAMPKSEFAALDTLKSRARKAGALAKKSVLIRAGLRALAAMPDAALTRAIQAVAATKR